MATAYPHSKALLSYLLTTYSTKNRLATSPPQATASTSQLELSVRKLALEQSRAASASASPSEASTDDESDTGISSSADSWDDSSEEDKIAAVLEMLGDDNLDEDDKPDSLKDLLRSILVMPLNEPVNLDPIILSLLHRYREDVSPSGNPVPPLPNHGSTTPGSRPSVSRSSSLRRGKPPGMNLGLPTSQSAAAAAAFSSSVSSTSSQSAPTSPFRAASPSIRSAQHTPSHSPWSSPRPTNFSLSAQAGEFKLTAGAGEFRPAGTSSPLAPGTPLRSHSPNPLAHHAQAQWAATSSPLGTPKFSGTPSHGGSVHGGSALSSPSYFPRHLDINTAHQLNKQKPARLPWADGSEDEEDDPEPREYDRTGAGGEGYIDTGSPWGQSPAGTPGGMIDPAYAQQYGAYPGGGEQEWAAQMQMQQQQQYGGYAGGAMWDGGGGAGYDDGAYGGEVHTPTYEGAGMTLPGPAPGEMPSIEFANSLSGPSGLGGMGAYQMSPFDHLLSIFSSTEMSPTVLEEALVLTGWDVDKAIEYLIETQPTSTSPSSTAIAPHIPPGLHPPPPPGFAAPPIPRTIATSGSRPLVVSRDSFDGYTGGNGGRGSPSGGPRWGSRPGTPTGEGRGVGGRVCRYYLSGNCLRSDCKFSHDVGKAVCKFWLRGHCLKGDGRCDFLHSIPPIMRADFEQRAQRRSAAAAGVQGYEEEHIPDTGPDLDFPTLGEAPRARRQGGPSSRTVQLDPTRTRFSGAVKYGPKLSGPLAAPRAPPVAPVPSRDTLPQFRRSARINLRPPALLPTLPTGQSLAALYIRYRSSFLELGANRNKCLARAAECWKRGDGAGARKFSREAQDWSRQVAIEGRDSAARIVEERKRVLKEALLENEDRSGDDVAHRKVRGNDRGGGVCLGVVAQTALPQERSLTVEERTEVALDLHALHTDEAISFMGDFLLSLERENFAGIAFVVIGQSKHSGSSAPDRGEAAGRLRLEQACTEFASDQGWAWQTFGGILSIDCQR